MTPRHRIVVCDAVPLAITLIAVALPLVFWDRLPEPLAVHWNGAGRPDGELGRTPLLLLIGGLGGGGWAMARLIGAQGVLPVLLRLSYCLAAVSIMLSVLTVWANLDAGTWSAARSIGIGLGLTVTVVTLVVGLGLGWFLEEGIDLPGPSVRSQPSLGLQIGERAAGVYTVQAPWGMVAPLAPIIALAIFRPYLWILAGIAAIVIAGLFRISVTVSEDRIEVTFGPWRWPRMRIPMETVTGASAEQAVHPLRYGVGYRVGPGVRASVLNRGPALHIETTGKKIIISMPHAEEAAGLINDLVGGASA